MTITITLPATGEPFGIGFYVQASTDLVGPIEPGSEWRLELTAPANEDVLAVYTRSYVTTVILQGMFNGNQTSTSIPWQLPSRQDGDAGQLRVQIVQPTFGVADEEVQAIVLDQNTGQAAALDQVIREHFGGVQAGLTEEEHEAVLQTNVGVIAMSGLSAIDLLGAVGSAIKSSPPFGWGSLSGAYTISGDGELPDLDALQDRYGVYWLATEIPAGLGHLHGNTEEYLLRIVQWRATHIVGGTEMVTELADFNWHGGLWRFSGTRPERIEYSILPGVTLEARWWQFP